MQNKIDPQQQRGKILYTLGTTLFVGGVAWGAHKLYKRLKREHRSLSLEDTLTRISIGGGFDVTLRLGHQNSLHLEGEPSYLEDVVVDQTEGMLRLQLAPWIEVERLRNPIVKVSIVISHLEQLSLLGESRVKMQGTYQGDHFSLIQHGGAIRNLKINTTLCTLNLAGSADTQAVLQAAELSLTAMDNTSNQLELKGKHLQMQVQGKAKVQLSGSVKECEARLSHRAKVHAHKLSCNQLKIHLRHNSEGEYHVEESYRVKNRGNALLKLYLSSQAEPKLLELTEKSQLILQR